MFEPIYMLLLVTAVTGEISVDLFMWVVGGLCAAIVAITIFVGKLWSADRAKIDKHEATIELLHAQAKLDEKDSVVVLKLVLQYLSEAKLDASNKDVLEALKALDSRISDFVRRRNGGDK